MFPTWWVDSYTCQKSLFPCNLTPAELQERFLDFFFFLICGLSQLQCKSNNHTVIALKKMVGEFICESSMLHVLVTGKSQVDSSVLNVYLWLLYSMLLAVWHASAEAMWWYKSFEKLLYIPRRACRWDFFIEVTSFLLLAHIP